MKQFLAWCKKEAVLSVALVLALVSACFVPPDAAYIDYIDFRTLGILFCLMAVMAGLQACGVFRVVAEALLRRVGNIRAMVCVLVMLCFFGSMLITNDVALITFVPLTFIVLRLLFPEGRDGLTVSVVVMQTVAANLGSMLTPIGNPQNLYLYGKSALPLGEFLLLMLPYTLAALVMLLAWCLLFRFDGDKRTRFAPETAAQVAHKGQIVVYGALFAVSLLAVAHVLHWGIAFAVTLAACLLVNRSVLKKVDYSLLATFVGFFVFVGNMGRIEAFYDLLARLIAGNEVLTAVAASQVMSNVPAALLLSGFTDAYDALLIGTNLGGLGTLIASMASLISFKYIGAEFRRLRGKYLLRFTLVNLLFLAVLLGLWLLIG
ncbi:MAG: citrate transporter [Oscillospiraceae bacterium]|nr:citrate transporter [Oscillospiraceae bacterium]